MSVVVRFVEVDMEYPTTDEDVHRVFTGFDLELPRERFVAVVGPSGCGKSTLLRLAAGLIEPTRGSVTRPARPDGITDCAFVFQEGDLLPWLTVEDNVAFGRLARAEKTEERRRAARRFLERVGLGDRADSYPRQLSLGMQRRVSVARAFASGADLLLLDEPFAALDAQTRWGLQAELERFWRDQPRTVLFVTHDVGEAIWLADRIVVLGGTPARTLREVEIPFSRPRGFDLRWSPEFRDLEQELWRSLPALAPAEREASEGPRDAR